jgi:hypothetical protein
MERGRSVSTMNGRCTKANIIDEGRRHRRHLFAVRFPSHIQQRLVKNSVEAAAWRTQLFEQLRYAETQEGR